MKKITMDLREYENIMEVYNNFDTKVNEEYKRWKTKYVFELENKYWTLRSFEKKNFWINLWAISFFGLILFLILTIW